MIKTGGYRAIDVIPRQDCDMKHGSPRREI